MELRNHLVIKLRQNYVTKTEIELCQKVRLD